MKIDRTSMFYGTFVLTCTSIVSQGLGFVYRILLSRLIGAEVMGLYQLVMPVYSVLLSVTAVGLTAAVSNLSSTYHARGEGMAVRLLLRRCLALFLAAFLPVAAVTALFSDPISVRLLGDARTRLGLVVLLPCVLLTGVENLHKHFFYGTGSIRPPAAVELCEQFIRTGAVLGLLVLFLPQYPERTVGLIVMGMTICEVFSACTLTLLARRSLSPSVGVPPDRRELDRRVRAIALPVGATALLSNLMGSATAVLIPQQLVRAGAAVSEAMSAFGVLCGMTLPMLCLPTAFIGALGLVLSPRLARATALGRPAQVRRTIDRSMLAVSALLLPVMAAMVVLGPAAGARLFKEPTVGEYILPLSVGVALSCYQSVFSCSLNGVGQQKLAARNAILCNGVQLGSTVVFMGLPGVGLKGYVAGFVLSTALGTLLNGCQVCRITGLRPRIFRWCTAPGLSALLMGLVMNLLFLALPGYGVAEIPAAAVSLIFGGVLYLAAMQAQGTDLRRLLRLSR